jgi:hypothetical protein
MKNFVQLDGNIEMINVLMNTLVEPLCGFENAYEFEDLDDIGMIRLYPEHIPAVNFQIVLISLYHRLNDPLYAEVQCNCEMPEPDKNSTFRLTCAPQQAQKRAEDFFIYNGIDTDRFIQLECPIRLDGTSTGVEMIAIGLTEEEANLLMKQGKTAVRSQKVHNNIEKFGNTVHNTGRIVANDIINPLATAAAKTTATIVSAGAKTIVDCAFAAGNEFLRDAAQLSLNEIKQRKEVKQMAYSLNKLMNKNQAKKSNNRTNNFDF